MARLKGVSNDDLEQRRKLMLYQAHRRELRAAGHDPDFIGTTEVPPVHCAGCGRQISWRTLLGY